MRILLVHNFYQQAGGEDQVFEDEGKLLEAQGHHVFRYTVDNDSVEGMGKLTLAAKTFWNRKTAADVQSLIERERVEITHFHNTFPLISPAAYYAARRAGSAVVQGVPNYRLLCPAAVLMRDGHVCEDCVGKRVAWSGIKHGCYRGSRPITAVVAGMLATHRVIGTWRNAVDRYIALTQFVRTKLVQGGLPDEKMAVKGNFVSPDPGVGSGDGGYAVFVGRLSPEKGIATLLSAWERIGSTVALKVLGDGPDAYKVREAVGKNSAIEWLGRRPVDEVLRIVGNASFLAFPSEWYEGQPKVILESFAKGTPVLASRHGSMTELIDEGINGMLFEPGNPVDLAEKAKSMTADTDRLAAMRRGARQGFEERYTAERNYGTLMDVYTQAIAARKCGMDPAAGDAKPEPLAH